MLLVLVDQQDEYQRSSESAPFQICVVTTGNKSSGKCIEVRLEYSTMFSSQTN
jgi:hypothetical protein